jgi:hypothetical protein
LNHDESDKILSHRELLKSFGAAEELADEMLNDQGNCFVSYNHHTTALFLLISFNFSIIFIQ